MKTVPERIIANAAAAGKRVATAESLTAGMVAAELGGVAGASAVLQGGVVAYQNTVKEHILGVDGALLASAGSVDARVAEEMAAGVRTLLNADYGLSTTGVAGPDPHDGKEVGTVFIGLAGPGGVTSCEFSFRGDRASIRSQACAAALELLAGQLEPA
ncbi:MAG: nicotinamide-nucleotide amidohydrolase family protein [Arthrobacter sp.]